jgi:hypothetical protein
MGIDSIDDDLSYGGVRFSEHELTDYGSRWEGREVTKVGGNSLEISPALNSLQPSNIHLPTIASSSPSRADTVINHFHQESQGDISNRPKERHRADLTAQEIREKYSGLGYRGEELEKRVELVLEIIRNSALPTSPLQEAAINNRPKERHRADLTAQEIREKYIELGYRGEELEKRVELVLEKIRISALPTSSLQEAVINVHESRDAEERRLENNARETYRKYYSGEELEKVVQWAMNNFRRAQKEGRDPEPSNLDQEGPTLDGHHLSPEIKPIHPLSSIDFSKGFVKGLPKGAKDSGKGFLSMAKEIIVHPLDTGEQMWDSLVLIKDLVRSGEWETLSEALVPEIHQLVTEWETIPSEERGRMAGYAFGKYGADILIPGALAKLGSKGVKGVQGLNVVRKGLQSTERTLLCESVAGLESSAKIGQVVRSSQTTIVLGEEIGLTATEMAQLKQAGKLEGAVDKALEKVISKSESGVLKAAIEQDKHIKFVEGYLNKPAKELQKGISSYEKQIAIHQEKISNPSKYYLDWDKLDPRQRDALINNKWPAEILLYEEQKDLLQSILNERLNQNYGR